MGPRRRTDTTGGVSFLVAHEVVIGERPPALAEDSFGVFCFIGFFGLASWLLYLEDVEDQCSLEGGVLSSNPTSSPSAREAKVQKSNGTERHSTSKQTNGLPQEERPSPKYFMYLRFVQLFSTMIYHRLSCASIFIYVSSFSVCVVVSPTKKMKSETITIGCTIQC